VAATRTSIKNLIDSPLLLFGSEILITDYRFDFPLLLLEHVDGPARSTLGHLLGVLTRGKLPLIFISEMTIIGVVAMQCNATQ
jgi:hypothetical protein